MRYLLRFDDIHERMDHDKFYAVKSEAERLGIKCILGVIPDCRDPKLISSSGSREAFFDFIYECKQYGDTIAQHGFQHIYHTESSGILGIKCASEFAGLPYSTQYASIRRGKEILNSQGIWEPLFMAPSHSFDHITLDVLKELKFKYLTDGWGFKPYSMGGLILVPQLTSKPIPFVGGIQTLCLHADTMSEKKICVINSFMKENQKKFVSFNSVVSSIGPHHMIDGFVRNSSSLALKAFRKLRKND